MKKILFLIIIVVLILLFKLKKNKDNNISPTNISNGITFEIPFKDKDNFYIEGLCEMKDKKVVLKDFLTNKVEDTNHIDNISVWFDDDLRADYSTGYIETEDINKEFKEFKVIKIDIKGDINHKTVKCKLL